MSIVRGLALAHLSATAVLLLLFVVLICVQRLVTSARTAAAARADAGASGVPVAYPTTAERSAIPAQDATSPGTSVLEWHVDLRDDARSAGSRELQRSS